MKRMASSNVLIVGVQGLGVEIGVCIAFIAESFAHGHDQNISERYRVGWGQVRYHFRPRTSDDSRLELAGAIVFVMLVYINANE